MKNRTSVITLVYDTIHKNLLFSFFLVLMIVLSVLLSLIPPLILEQAINHLTDGTIRIGLTAVLYFIVVMGSGLSDALKESLITGFGQKVTHRIRTGMSEKLNRLPTSYLMEHDAGETSSLFVNDVDTVEKLFSSGIISMAADLFRLLSILVVIFSRSKGLFLLLLGVTPFLVFLTRSVQKKTLQAQLMQRKAVADTSRIIPETVENMRIIRLLERQDFMCERYGKSIDESYHAQEKTNFQDAFYSPVIISVSSLLIGTVMAASAMQGGIRTFFGMSAGTAAAMISYIGSFFTPLESIGMEIQNIQSAAAGVKRIGLFLKEAEKEEKPCMKKDDDSIIEADHITFGYSQRDHLFEDFSLSVRQGENIILSGRTGCGKSTLVKLMAGLYEPQKGEIRMFGMPVQSIPEKEKRKLYGYVEQKWNAVAGTIRDQIAMCDERISDEMVWKALNTVGLSDTVRALPDGLDTPFTAGLFSQGQMQLVGIARAIVMDPPVLLLDEVTASLDSNTEQMVLKALHSALENRTAVSVSHRLSLQETEGNTRIISLSSTD